MASAPVKKISRIEELSRSETTKNRARLWKRHKFAVLLFFLSLLAAFPYRKIITIESYPKSGEISLQTVVAPFNINIMKSDTAFSAEVAGAESSVPPVFRKESRTAEQACRILDTLQARIIAVEKSSESSVSARTELEKQFSPEEITVLAKNPALAKILISDIKSALTSGLLSHVSVENLSEIELYREKYDAQFKHILSSSASISVISGKTDSTVHKNLYPAIPDLYGSLFEKTAGSSQDRTLLASALYTIFESYVPATLVYDPAETGKRRDEARARVKPTLRTIPKNVEIVRKHQIVTPVIAENLSALQKQYHEQFASSIMVKSVITQCTTLLLLIGLAVILIRNLRRLVPQGIDRRIYFNSLAVITAISFFIMRIGAVVMETVSPGGLIHSSAVVYTAVPMIIGSLMAAALFNRETGFVLTIFFSVFGGIIGGYDPIIPIGVLISGGIVCSLAASLRYRRDFLSMAIWVSVTNILIGITMVLIDGADPTVPLFAKTVLFSAGNAVASVAFSFLLLPLLEQHFHLTTDMTLMELADMNHPLLKRLAIEAPGTYNHSIMVANLAEAAADAIGADGLLCRVVSYYHDIGKLKKPGNFIENQYSKRNIHDKISPSMSVRLIAAHVREGLELAEEYHLPQAIKDVIPQHHGDGPMSFFYHKALEERAEGAEIDIRDYSYGGPKPQTRENAVVMIADSVEAASRTLKTTSIKEVREAVKKIIWTKVAQDQLDECGLTLSDLSEIINGMMPILEGVFHSRIEYPDEEEREDGQVQA